VLDAAELAELETVAVILTELAEDELDAAVDEFPVVCVPFMVGEVPAVVELTLSMLVYAPLVPLYVYWLAGL